MTHDHQQQLITHDFVGGWGDLADQQFDESAIAVIVEDHTQALAALAHAQGRELLIVAAARIEPGLVSTISECGLTLIWPDGRVEKPAKVRAATPGRIWLLTSGSTGRPKMVAHTLKSLTTVSGEQPERIWLCPYTPGAYAWWQMVTLAWSAPGQSMVFVEGHDFDRWPEIALEYRVSAVSGTPTFWRQAILRSGETLAQVPLAQITLGGEPVDQTILDTLKTTFPKARISWIYASSEAGAVIAVHDGKAGFPHDWLNRAKAGRPQLRIESGELYISSPNRGDGIAEWLATGDRAEIREGRVHITGRLGKDELNVGGSKVSIAEVRDVLLTHPKVVWAAVKGRRAPLVGLIVTAQVVAPGVSEIELTQFCAEYLADYAVPRRLTFLDDIPMKESLKSDV